MSATAMPEYLNLAKRVMDLPQGTKVQSVASSPINGATFTPGSTAIIPLITSGILVPNSMYIAYSYAFTATVASEMIGTPVYTPINSLQTQIGGNTTETIANYNVVMNTLTNMRMSVGEKYGNQASYGYFNSTSVPTLEQLDGRILVVNEAGTFSAPLECMLNNCETGVPLFMMPECRIVLTFEALANQFTSAVAVPTALTISNLELRYKVVKMNGQIESAFRAIPQIEIKSRSFASSTNTLAAGSSGYMELVYNLRYNNLRNLIAVNGVGTALSNKNFDSVDLTSNTGEYSFSIAGVNYPQKSLSTARCRAQILQEMRSVSESLTGKRAGMSINTLEYNFNGTAATSTLGTPAKFYPSTCLVGTSLLGSGESIQSGVSTENSPISYRITSGGSIGANNSAVTLIAQYDAVIMLDTASQQVFVKV